MMQNSTQVQRVLSESARDVAAAAAGAALAIALVQIGTRIDATLNPDIVKVLKDNCSWTRLFTSHHAVTALIDLYPLAVNTVYGALGAALGVGHRRLHQ